VFNENNTYETWKDAKKLGALDKLEAARPKVKALIYEFYNEFNSLRREAEDMKILKRCDIERAIETIYYEQDKAVEIIQKADDYYLKLCAAKIKRMNAKP